MEKQSKFSSLPILSDVVRSILISALVICIKSLSSGTCSLGLSLDGPGLEGWGLGLEILASTTSLQNAQDLVNKTARDQ